MTPEHQSNVWCLVFFHVSMRLLLFVVFWCSEILPTRKQVTFLYCTMLFDWRCMSMVEALWYFCVLWVPPNQLLSCYKLCGVLMLGGVLVLWYFGVLFCVRTCDGSMWCFSVMLSLPATAIVFWCFVGSTQPAWSNRHHTMIYLCFKVKLFTVFCLTNIWLMCFFCLMVVLELYQLCPDVFFFRFFFVPCCFSLVVLWSFPIPILYTILLWVLFKKLVEYLPKLLLCFGVFEVFSFWGWAHLVWLYWLDYLVLWCSCQFLDFAEFSWNETIF